MSKYRYRCIGFLILLSCVAMQVAEAHHWAADKNERAGWNQNAQARSYFHHSELQLQSAMRALAVPHINEAAHVLDFGCGDGKLSAILAAGVPYGSVLGVDVSKPMIEFAQRKFAPRTVSNLRFQQIEDLSDIEERFEGSFDWITSFCVFHLISEPSPVLESMWQLLREEGQVLFVIPAHSPPRLVEAGQQVFDEMGLETPWSSEEFAKKKRPPMRQKESCCALIEEAGFSVSYFEEEPRPYVFFDDQELVDWLVGTLASNWGVPWQQAPEFFRRAVEVWKQLYPECQHEDGTIDFACGHFVCVAKKQAGR